MSDSDNVVEESLPQAEELPREDYEGRMAAFVEEQMAASEESSPSATLSEEGETEPATDESAEVEAAPEDGEAEAEAESEEEVIAKSAFLKRVNGLNAAKRKLEKENLDFQREVSEYREAFQLLMARARKAEQELAEYKDFDPREQKILEYERQKEADAIRQKLEAEHQERIKAMEQQAVIDSRADEIINTANYLAEKYQTITAEELVYKFRNSEESLEDLAKNLHDTRYKAMRTMFAKENKPSAPRKIKPQGSMAVLKGNSEDDMLDYLESMR
jgi:hypothetical protein